MGPNDSRGLNRFYAGWRFCELLENQKLGADSPEAKRIEKIRKQKNRRKRRRKQTPGTTPTEKPTEQ